MITSNDYKETQAGSVRNHRRPDMGREKLQTAAFFLLLLSCITSGLLETHFLLGLWVTTGLIGTAGVLVYTSNHEEG